VRGKDVYVVQPTGPPVNDNIMELLLMARLKSKCSSYYSGDPYYGYASSGSQNAGKIIVVAGERTDCFDAKCKLLTLFDSLSVPHPHPTPRPPI
jgi:hypothetical protein